MLLLTRRIGEQIIIGNDIILKVIEIDRNQVRLAIHAPADIIIDREEVHLRRKKERENNNGYAITHNKDATEINRENKPIVSYKNKNRELTVLSI